MEIILTAIVLCNNFNWEHSERCTSPPISIEIDAQGDFYGELESGVMWTQKRVLESDLGSESALLSRFQMEDAFWFVSDKGTFYADDNLQALSKYLTL